LAQSRCDSGVTTLAAGAGVRLAGVTAALQARLAKLSQHCTFGSCHVGSLIASNQVNVSKMQVANVCKMLVRCTADCLPVRLSYRNTVSLFAKMQMRKPASMQIRRLRLPGDSVFASERIPYLHSARRLTRGKRKRLISPAQLSASATLVPRLASAAAESASTN
jgi:hypothetical protein